MHTLVRWFAENNIAANLLMIFIFVGGLTALGRINKEVNPSFRDDVVSISISYRGAGPKEVEQQICLRIEESLEGTEGMDKLTCTASSEFASARVEAVIGFPIERLLNSVKSRVEGINTFPEDVERPIIEEVIFKRDVASVSISGNMPERELKEYAETIREELLALPNVPSVRIQGTRDYEVSIELSETDLRRYNLTFSDVANAINFDSVTLPGGSIETPTGDIQIQARNQAYNRADFEKIPIKTASDGTIVYLSEIAVIKDGFVENELISNFNGERAAYLNVQVSENPNVLKTSEQITEYIEQRSKTLPSNLTLTLWQDNSNYFLQRVDTLLTNGLMGLALVFILLVIFLRPKVAVWVTVGIAIAFIGTLFALPAVGISLNMISLFAFILVLGIVVDDAIIIGENIHRVQEKRLPGLAGAKLGATQMANPVFFAVTTSIVVFIPMTMMPGDFGHFLTPIAIVPILALSFSLIESLLILPAHLSHMKPEKRFSILAPLDRVRDIASHGLKYFLVMKYRPFLRKCLKMRFFTVSCFTAVLILCIGLVAGGKVRVSLTPEITLDTIIASVELPLAAPFSEVEATLEEVRLAANKTLATMEEKYGQSVAKDVFLVASGNRIEFVLEVVPPNVVEVDTAELGRLWRENLGDMPQAEKVTAQATFGFQNNPIELELSGSDLNQLTKAANWLSEKLDAYPGIFGVEQSLRAGRPEMEISSKSLTNSLGINLRDISNQTRQAFFGQEAQRIPRGREDVRVMVRYPKEDRESIYTLHNFRIRASSGAEVPFDTVAKTTFVPGYADITRIDGQAIISVTSDFTPTDGNTVSLTIQQFLTDQTTEFQQLFPGIGLSLEGEQKENQEFSDSMTQLGLLSLLGIFALLAIQFKSWWQPGLVLSAIPFGFAGAVIMHLIKGDALTMLSFFGILASAGVVVNDSLVFIDRINVLRSQGFNLHYCILQAGSDRFRPIMLTTITTFVGLTPIMLETSLQAQFLIPMAMSLAFGVATASIVTLIMLPCAYSMWHQIIHGKQHSRSTTLATN